jgi:hypothetical protein
MTDEELDAVLQSDEQELQEMSDKFQ